MAKDGYKFVRDRRNVTFLNTAFSRYPYINQLLNVCPRNTGSVEVSGSIPLGSTIYEACSHSRHQQNTNFQTPTPYFLVARLCVSGRTIRRYSHPMYRM